MNWRAEAVCGQMVADGRMTLAESDAIFFSAGRPTASIICATCPVTVECRDFASTHAIPDGLFGGEHGAHRRARLGISVTGERIERAA